MAKHGMPAGAEGRTRLVAAVLRTDYIRRWTAPPTLADTMAATRREEFHGIFDGLLTGWTARQGKARWGEKTPQRTLPWREVQAGLPDMQVVHVVRDGRDVALSYRAANFGPKHIYPLAQRWVAYLQAADEARGALGEESFLTTRYEDLLRDPEGEIRRVCAILGERFDPLMLAHYRTEVSYPTDRRNEGNLRRPLLTDNAGKTAVRNRQGHRLLLEWISLALWLRLAGSRL